jgi:hypothetical protein
MDGVFVESADIDISSGEQFTFIKKLIPDMEFIQPTGTTNTPAMNVVLKRRNFPNDTLVTDSTSQITPTFTFSNVRTRSRQVVIRFESDDDNTADNRLGYKWRIGTTRLDIQPSGRR